MGIFVELRCVLTRPFGHQWEDVEGEYFKAPGALYAVRLGPLRVCLDCGAEDWGNGEQSVGG